MHVGAGDKKCHGLKCTKAIYGLKYTKAVYIIRSPFDAIYAEYNRYYVSVNRQASLLSQKEICQKFVVGCVSENTLLYLTQGTVICM